MKVLDTSFADVKLFEPQVFGDERGYFYESFRQSGFDAAIGRPVQFVQENQSRSGRHVLRGLHFQVGRPQGKLVRVLAGSIFDVVVDMRAGSSTFGCWEGFVLDEENRRQLWVPEGFAHGFVVTSGVAEITYKVTDYWYPEGERCLHWADPDINIVWPLDGEPVVSEKDAGGRSFAQLRDVFSE